MSRCRAGYSDPCSTCSTSSDLNSIALAMAWPWAGPSSNVRKINKSSVPCSSSMRSLCSLVDILGDDKFLLVECQGEQKYGSWPVSPITESMKRLTRPRGRRRSCRKRMAESEHYPGDDGIPLPCRLWQNSPQRDPRPIDHRFSSNGARNAELPAWPGRRTLGTDHRRSVG